MSSPSQSSKSKSGLERSSIQELPHSKVIHCRAVAEGCKEIDLVNVMKLFGNVRAAKLMPRISQGLLEFAELESAIACVTYSKLQPILVNGREIYVNYSKSTEITNTIKNNLNQEQIPTNILLLTVMNVIHPVTVDTLRKICQQQNIDVQRIVIFHKNGLQALVEFESVDNATQIYKAFNGCDIYPGCCTLKIEYSKASKLNIRGNTSESYDIDLENTKDEKNSSLGNGLESLGKNGRESLGNGRESLLNGRESLLNGQVCSEVAAVLAAAEGLPAVQTILARVMMERLSLNERRPENIQGTPRNLMGNENLRSQSNSAYPPANHNILHQLVQQGINQSINQQGRLTNANSQEKTNYFDKYSTPFATRDETLTENGGDGCVAMVYGINNDFINCNHLYNLFCLYGNVTMVKILVNKPGCAMVQYAQSLSTEMAIENLNDINLFGQVLQVTFSKHPSISDSRQTSTLFDDSPATTDYSDSRNNRFKFVPGGNNNLFSRVHSPSKVLHYFNAPPDITEERIEELFTSLNYEVQLPTKQAAILKPNSKSASGLLEFSSISGAVEALMLLNHTKICKTSDDEGKPGAPFTFKLAFSPSESINTHD